MADFARAEMKDLFGRDFVRRLRPLVASGETWSGTAYSYARLGGASGRAVPAEPLDGRVFLAGEACSRDAFSTAHGAYLSGRAAAGAVVTRLGHAAAR